MRGILKGVLLAASSNEQSRAEAGACIQLSIRRPVKWITHKVSRVQQPSKYLQMEFVKGKKRIPGKIVLEVGKCREWQLSHCVTYQLWLLLAKLDPSRKLFLPSITNSKSSPQMDTVLSFCKRGTHWMRLIQGVSEK